MNNKRIIAKIISNVNDKKRKCLHSECKENSINSHLIQKNGILNNISKNGHLIEVKLTNPYYWNKSDSPLQFKKIGINKAISLKIFCNKHDTQIFKEIEQKNKKFSNYKSFILLSYRATCAEIRKKEMNIDIYNRLLYSKILFNQINRTLVEFKLKAYELSYDELIKLKNIFEKEIINIDNNFIYKTFEYPLIEVYASAIFSPLDKDIIYPDNFSGLNNIFIHLLPSKDTLTVLIGYHKDFSSNWIKEYIKSWGDLSLLELEKKITELFTLRIESWGMSIDLYYKISKEKKKRYIRLFIEHIDDLKENSSVDFNLFRE